MTEELDCFGTDASRNDGKSRNDGTGKNWIASALMLLAMTSRVKNTYYQSVMCHSKKIVFFHTNLRFGL